MRPELRARSFELTLECGCTWIVPDPDYVEMTCIQCKGKRQDDDQDDHDCIDRAIEDQWHDLKKRMRKEGWHSDEECNHDDCLSSDHECDHDGCLNRDNVRCENSDCNSEVSTILCESCAVNNAIAASVQQKGTQ